MAFVSVFVQSIDKLVCPPVAVDENRLQCSYSFWFTHLARGSVSSSASDYEDQIKHVSSFSTVCEPLIHLLLLIFLLLLLLLLLLSSFPAHPQVEQFWAGYCHMTPPSQLPHYSTIHLFKMGIKPMWEVCVSVCVCV